MHGRRNLTNVMRDKVSRPVRVSNQRVFVGTSWALEESPDGHLQITNVKTGSSTILAFQDEEVQADAPED